MMKGPKAYVKKLHGKKAIEMGMWMWNRTEIKR
jgi:hypothetical protein